MDTRRQQEKKDTKTRKRRKRTPLGGFKLKLATDFAIPADKVGRWINDDPGRLIAAQEGGYEFVSNPHAEVGEGSEEARDSMTMHIRRIVGTHENGEPKYAYLMVIDKDLYEQDQQVKENDRKEVDKAINLGQLGPQEGGGRYVPKGGISIRSNF